MIEIKNKTITAESLSALHEHNKSSYMSKLNPAGSGTMEIDGDGSFSGHLTIGNIRLEPTEDALNIVFLDEGDV